MGAVSAGRSAGRLALRSVRAVAARPRLWPTATALLLRFAPDRWWRRPPFMPLPPEDLLRFRSETMYGDPARAPSPTDLVAWLEWCRAQGARRPQPCNAANAPSSEPREDAAGDSQPPEQRDGHRAREGLWTEH